MTPPQTAFEITGETRPADIVVCCDHASNRVPEGIGDLGIRATDMARHIAYDVGAAGVARRLGALLDAPVICSNFSRLVIDPNRGEDDPTLIMEIYDGTIIPGNRHLQPGAREWRLKACYQPYHAALSRLMRGRKNPILISIHSFTAQLNGHPKRPWHMGILHENDDLLARPLIARLRAEPDLCVGENEPYGGHLDGDTIDKHALSRNIPNVLIEIRNDLIKNAPDQQGWAERLAPILLETIANAGL